MQQERKHDWQAGRVGVVLILALFFTCFGQRREHHWTYIDTDTDGFHYYVDAYGVREVTPHVYEFMLRKSAADSPSEAEPVSERWFRLDGQLQTIEPLDDDSGPGPIPSGSVAESVMQRLPELTGPRTPPPDEPQ